MIKTTGLLLFLLQSASSPVGHWVYAFSYDRMRETRTQIAGLEAVNKATLGQPYKGTTRATLVVRKIADRSFVQILIENGTISCTRCDILVKLDPQPATYWKGDAGESHSSLIIDAPVEDGSKRAFDAADEIAKAHQIQIEVPFYAKGAFQYKFLTSSDLSWPKQ